MRETVLAVGALAAVSLSVACTDDAAAPASKAGARAVDEDGGADPGAGGPSTRTDGRADPALYAKALCESQKKCGPVGFRRLYTSLDDCIAKVLPQATASLTAPGNTVTPAQLAACTSKLVASCDDTLFTSPECAFRGALPVGAPCAYGGQCDSSLCLRTGASCGTCAPVVAPGMDCTNNANCETGFACVDGACRVLGGEGSACTSAYACKATLTCFEGTCQRRLGLGASCTVPSDCDDAQGLTCIPSGSGASEGTCKPPPFAKLNEPCGLDQATGVRTECEASRCTSDDGAGSCVAFGAAGAACTAGTMQCASGLTCVEGECASFDAASCK